MNEKERELAYCEAFEAFTIIHDLIRETRQAYGRAYASGDIEAGAEHELLKTELALKKAAETLGSALDRLQSNATPRDER